MVNKRRCPECGSDMPQNAPEDLCPKCLIRMGFEGEADTNSENSAIIEGPGTKIGRYELLSLIGEGGMGLVYLAEQKEPVRRKVALKIVKLGMDTVQVVARFETERQTLALLEHPNIAHVLDAGTTETGRPYFVMEYVKGKSITKYCDEQKLNVEERLKVFHQACEAVHHAHQKGIIHRDIKPSNILVSVQDGKPVPKIIDFGIAKAITYLLTDKTSYTEHGQLLGTPEYMSPEQAEMACQDIDIRSDIYSLGVVLYELLAGVTPFDAEVFREGGLKDIQKIICQEEPRTPSVRLTSLDDKAKEIAQSRRTQIITLTRRLHRELEWIPMKAMRKDRTRRYKSAAELADDIDNYLNGRPLIAGPESTVYRARKFVRKHAGSVAAAALFAMVITLGLAVSIIMGCREKLARKQEAAARLQVEQALVRAEQAERVAQEQRKKSEQLAEDYRKALYFNRIALADVACHNNNVQRARELLGSCPEDLRGWEWHRLNYISDQSCATLHGHTKTVWGVAVSPDGKRIASGSFDNTVRVWDIITGTELMTLRGHTDRVGPVAFSPDCKRIASGGMDQTVRIWDATTGEELMKLNGHDSEVQAVAFSPDGKRILSDLGGNTIKVWDTTTGTELMTLEGHKANILTAVFSPDGKRIASGGQDSTVKVWDASSGNELMTLRGHKGDVLSVVFSPDGARIASASRDGTLKLWDASSGEEIMTLRGHTGKVCDIAFAPGGRRLVSAGADRVIRVWHTRTGAELMTLHGHVGVVHGVAFSPDGKWIVSGSGDGTVKVWDATFDHEYMRIPAGGGTWQGVSFSPDGNRVLSGSRDPGGLIRVWDRWTGAELMTLHGAENDTIACATFSPDGKRIFGGQIRRGTIWDAITGEQLVSLRAKKGYLLATFSPDSEYLATWEADWSGEPHDNTITLREAQTGAPLMSLTGHEAEVQAVAFSPDGKQVVSGDLDGTINQWNMGTGEKLRTLQYEGALLAMAFNPDGSRLATSGTAAEPAIEVWDVETGARIMTLHGHSAAISSVAFSSDGKRIVSGSKDKTVRVWDAVSGTELLTIRQPRRHDGWTLPATRFSPDGKTIAVGGFGGIMLLESEVLSDGYKAWRNGAAARKVVDKLHE